MSATGLMWQCDPPTKVATGWQYTTAWGRIVLPRKVSPLHGAGLAYIAWRGWMDFRDMLAPIRKIALSFPEVFRAGDTTLWYIEDSRAWSDPWLADEATSAPECAHDD